jgi:hypothetical protein
MGLHNLVATYFTPYSTPPTNYIGTTHFLPFVVFTIFLTSFMISDLCFSYIHRPLPAPAQKRLLVLSFLSLITFAVSSFNMPGFLRAPFSTWMTKGTGRGVWIRCYNRHFSRALRAN